MNNNISTGEVVEADDLNNEFNALVSAFNATTGHSHDGTSSEGAPITVVGPTQDVVVQSTIMRPRVTNTVNLGSGTYSFRNGYFTGPVQAPSFIGAVTGNSTTATTLATPRNFSITGGATAANVAFNGSSNVVLNVTALNANSLTTGIVPNDRISGSYTNFGNITAAGTVTSENFRVGARVFGFNLDSETAPTYSWFQFSQTGMYLTAESTVGFTNGGSTRLTIGENIIARNGASFSGDGSQLTGITFSSLTGTIPSAMVSGNYSNFDNISGSNNANFLRFRASGVGGTETSPAFSFDQSTNSGLWWSGTGLSISIFGERQIRITDGQLLLDNGAFISGSGSGLTNVPSTSLTGIINTARIDGNYGNITGVGALNVGSITSGFGNINIGTNVFTGNGSGLTNLNGGAISSGTISSTRLPTIPVSLFPTSTTARDWVLDRNSEATTGAIGTYAMLKVDSGSRPVSPNATRTGSVLFYSNSGTTSSTNPSGTWRCMGEIFSNDTATLFMRIA